MGQTHGSGEHFHSAAVKGHYVALQTLWAEDDLQRLADRLKDMTLNFSLDKVKFARLLQLSETFNDLVAQWYTDFSQDRASHVVDGLEFLAAAAMLSSKVSVFSKISLLFSLFDLDRSNCIRKDEFTIFLKAASTGLHHMVEGLPPPGTVVELGGISSAIFGTLAEPALSQPAFFKWVTETRESLHYLSVFSRLGPGLFAWGMDQRFQLGLDFESRLQRLPSPLLKLEGVRIAAVATSESHTLFLTQEGHVWSCGSGFCGILGHGSVEDCRQPRFVEAFGDTAIVGVAVGVRHSVAVSEGGKVFTWGAADLGQLGHGSTENRDIHEWAFDPSSGGGFAYVSKPTVVMGLLGTNILCQSATCCNFSTGVVSDKGDIYTWGNNTDGQCGQGQRCPDHAILYVDPHMQRTAMMSLLVPRKIGTKTSFRGLTGGGYHMLAVDKDRRLWSWGRGQWGALGHGDMRSQYDPKLVDSLKYQVISDAVAGEVHSVCLASLYRLTVTGNSPGVELSPFSLLGLPCGRVDRQMAARKPVVPAGTELQLNAFASAPLLRMELPFRHEEGAPVVDVEQYPLALVQQSVLLIDHGFGEGEWLRLHTMDYDFSIKLSLAGAEIPATGLSAPVMLAMEGKWEDEDCRDMVCLFDCPAELAGKSEPEEIVPTFLDFAVRCQQSGGVACILILPEGMEEFGLDGLEEGTAEEFAVRQIALGMMGHEHGVVLKKHVTQLISVRIAEATCGKTEEARDWKECREDFTGRVFYENAATGDKRWAPPLIFPKSQATLVVIEEDNFMSRLMAILELKPKGLIVCQQSWLPDVEFVPLEEAILEHLQVPIVLVTFEAGEELKSVAAGGSRPVVTMEVQPYGGVCAWGNGTHGQLGLGGIEHRTLLVEGQNVLTAEKQFYTNKPCYVSHLHEHQVTSVACGAAHTAAVTLQGEVFAWGRADAVGAAPEQTTDAPTFVEQLEGLVKATRAYAGHHHTMVSGDLPYRSVV